MIEFPWKAKLGLASLSGPRSPKLLSPSRAYTGTYCVCGAARGMYMQQLCTRLGSACTHGQVVCVAQGKPGPARSVQRPRKFKFCFCLSLSHPLWHVSRLQGIAHARRWRPLALHTNCLCVLRCVVIIFFFCLFLFLARLPWTSTPFFSDTPRYAVVLTTVRRLTFLTSQESRVLHQPARILGAQRSIPGPGPERPSLRTRDPTPWA